MIRFFNAASIRGSRWFSRSKNRTQLSELNPEYSNTSFLNELRDKDFARLDEQNHTYLDFTGGHLYPESLVKKHQEFLSTNILGNPHSINPSSALAEKHINEARNKVLEFFNAQNDYICIFTSNASAALKIIGECYPFASDGQLLLTFDNHNSVNGIREFARKANCPFTYSPLDKELRIDSELFAKNIQEMQGKNKLLAFPAQSNVSGVKHNLEWVQKAQQENWDVLLDAAAFVPSDRLDLQKYKPEFVSVSFYKIFGYPTGIGALLAKKSAFDKLKKPSFTGGTITIVSVQGDGYYLEKEAARFEEGTINYLEIPAVKTGLEFIEQIGIDHIKSRVQHLTEYLIKKLLEIKHKNGAPLIKIHGPKNGINRGGTIAMNFFDKEGTLHDFQQIESDAYKRNISLRTGCFCNPGIDETNHQLNAEKLKIYFQRNGEKDYFGLINFLNQKRGAVRVSVGYISNLKDMDSFLNFCTSYLNKKATSKN